MALPCDAVGLSAVCDCGISRSNSLTIILEKFTGSQRDQMQLGNYFELCLYLKAKLNNT